MDLPEEHGPLPHDAKTVKSVKARLRTPQTTFRNLCLDPFALDRHHWELQSPEVQEAMAELKRLDRVRTLTQHPEVHDDKLGDLLDRCLRTLWPTLILWLDYLHPMHHKGTPRLEKVPLQTLSCTFFSLFEAQGPAIAALRAHTPHMYRMLFLLWLRFDEYCTPRTDIAKGLDVLACAVKRTLWIDGTAAQPPSDAPALRAYVEAHLDPQCVPAAVSVARHRPRRVYSQALKQAGLLLELIAAHPDACFVPMTALSRQIDAINNLLHEVLPLDLHARETVRALADILRVIHTIPVGRKTACDIVYMLRIIWNTCKDERALVWSLRDDVVPVLLAFQSQDALEQRNRETVQDVLGLIAQSTFHVRVLRALSKGGQPVSFRGAGFLSEDMLVALDQWINHRNRIMLNAYDKRCGFPQCDAAPGESLQRCACLSKYYCSRKCQRADWEAHRMSCINGPWSDWGYVQRCTAPAMLAKTSTEDAYFTAFYCQNYFHCNSPIILKSVLRLQETAPPTNGPPAFSVFIDLVELFCTYRVYMDDQSPRDPLTNPRSEPDRTYTSMSSKFGLGVQLTQANAASAPTEPSVTVVAVIKGIDGPVFLNITCTTLGGLIDRAASIEAVTTK